MTLRLGLTSFGGPIAHLGYQRKAFVDQHGWLDEAAFADLVALCQTLPGPASSQLTIAVGRLRAGWAGAARGVARVHAAQRRAHDDARPGCRRRDDPDRGGRSQAPCHGLKVAAVAVVAQAVVAMGRRLTPDAAADRPRGLRRSSSRSPCPSPSSSRR